MHVIKMQVYYSLNPSGAGTKLVGISIRQGLGLIPAVLFATCQFCLNTNMSQCLSFCHFTAFFFFFFFFFFLLAVLLEVAVLAALPVLKT